jgi:hypothetical protein
MGKTVKIGPTLSKILLSVVDKTAYLGAAFACRFFPARNDLVHKLKHLRKRVTSATTFNSRIIKSFSDQAGISIGK